MRGVAWFTHDDPTDRPHGALRRFEYGFHGRWARESYPFDAGGFLRRALRELPAQLSVGGNNAIRTPARNALPYPLLISLRILGVTAASRAIYTEVTPFASCSGAGFWRGWSCFLVAGHLRRDWRQRLATGDDSRHRRPGGLPILGYIGIRYTTAVNAALLNNTVPLFTTSPG
jgi:hypothetical protein